ncbi:MAG TPA: SpvB/TcaC N-terminal domain-containing protein, partial [Polyangia bacterium]|nr:SpvB/TcaC N-terminal domain-containing protein [Polyangia bacterium]
MTRNLLAGVLGILLTTSGGIASAQTGSDAPVNAYFGTFGSAVSISVPAYHGLEPSLQLSYSSSASNGVAGVGWGLGGFGTVERASPGRGTPLYSGADVFLLDGQELVPCAAGSASPSCTTGGTHSTRIENYQRIKFDGGANTWTVWRKDGTRLVYGALYGVAAGTFRWGLSSVTDTRGNQVSYGWWCGGGDCYPDNVSYNGTTVRLYREARPDPITFPTGSGTLGRTLYRLRSIDVTVAGARSRTYRLQYGTSASTGRSLLANVQEFGRDASVDAAGAVLSGSAHPARTYAYDSAASVTRSATWGNGHGNGDAGWSYADIDGDGKAEYVTHSNNGTHYATFFNRDGTLTNRTWTGGHGVGDSGSSYADIDGDGKAEYVTHSGNGTHYATFFNKDGTLTNRTWTGGHGDGDAGWTYADIDGDGKAEYVTHSGNGSHYATFFNKDGTLTNRTWLYGGHGVG